jgi:hypothetical protein
MNNTNIGVLQLGDGLGFLHEAGVGFRARREVGRQNLNGYGSIQAGVFRPINFSHSARA